MKVCNKCGEEKALDEYPSNGVGRVKARCKVCYNERTPEEKAAKAERKRVRRAGWTPEQKAARAAADAERARERRAAWTPEERAAKNERARERWANRAAAHAEAKLLRVWGDTEAYEKLVDRCGDACGICGRTEAEEGQRLAIDHCHDTGAVRGLLCAACNTALGRLGDNRAGLLAALRYLEDLPGDSLDLYHQEDSSGRLRV